MAQIQIDPENYTIDTVFGNKVVVVVQTPAWPDGDYMILPQFSNIDHVQITPYDKSDATVIYANDPANPGKITLDSTSGLSGAAVMVIGDGR